MRRFFYLAGTVTIVLQLLGCAGSSQRVTSGLAQEYKLKNVQPLDSAGCLRYLEQIMHAFNDTISQADLHNDYSRARERLCDDSCPRTPHIDNLIAAFTVLRYHGLTVLELTPDTYEAIRALSPQRIVTGILVLRTEGKEVTSLERNELLDRNRSLFAAHAEDLHCDIIKNIKAGENSYTLITGAGDILSGAAHDRIVGQVYSSTVPDGKDSYSRIASLFVVTGMEQFNLSAYLDEWYSRLPHRLVQPKVDEFEWK
ncbi:MAG: hypothetical protein GF401_04065 [Chitinivibrionales bacterium]|nr:hypothetical protein [Chitinivibrionales bacterium]